MLENFAVELIIIQVNYQLISFNQLVILLVYVQFGGFYKQHQSCRGRKPAKVLLVFAGKVGVLVCILDTIPLDINLDNVLDIIP